jgi:hypothetical protein
MERTTVGENDMGEPLSLSHFIYVPRNRDNFIRKDDDYELFYFDKSWHSLGRKTANADSLVYNVPVGSLLYLKNHTRGEKNVYSPTKTESKFGGR